MCGVCTAAQLFQVSQSSSLSRKSTVDLGQDLGLWDMRKPVLRHEREILPSLCTFLTAPVPSMVLLERGWWLCCWGAIEQSPFFFWN